MRTSMLRFWHVRPKIGFFSFVDYKILLAAVSRLAREEWKTEMLFVKIDFFDRVPDETLALRTVPLAPNLFEVRESGIYASTPAVQMLSEKEWKRAVFVRARVRPRERSISGGEIIVDFWSDKSEMALVFFPFDNFHLLKRRSVNGYLNEFLWELLPPPRATGT